MSELIDKLRGEFQDKEYRHAYTDECLNTMIATQIKVLREQREMTQEQLAEETGMRQPRIPLLEDAGYSNWTINTLRRFAKAFDVALSVRFETFSRVISDFENLSRESLQRVAFADDTQFQYRRETPRRRLRRRENFQAQRHALQSQLQLFPPRGQVIQWPQQHESELDAAQRGLAATRQGEAYAIGVGSAG
jgi:transcriptional regulator with XRE-family HTH domain